MNATQAKNLLMPIPKEDFITNQYSDRKGKCCAIGHLVRLESADPNDYSTDNCADTDGGRWFSHPIRKVTKSFIKTTHGDLGDISDVNNHTEINGYTEGNPKDRVMHLLDDMIEAGL